MGVTVTNHITGKRTQTNQVGYFTIDAEKGQKLTVTYVGYVAKEITVGDDKKLTVRLVAYNKEMDNVVVTAYGQTRNKRELSTSCAINWRFRSSDMGCGGPPKLSNCLEFLKS